VITPFEEQRARLSYSPERRTALVLCGTGTHGAYHAGVLRALQEAGVKIDLFGGQGIGAAGAALAAIAGGARLWDSNGIWRSSRVAALYAWRWSIRAAAWIGVVLVALLLTPLFVLALGLVVFPAGFLLEVSGSSAGGALVSTYSAWLQTAFAGDNLPTVVPRLIMLGLIAVLLLLAGAAAVARRRLPTRRRAEGAWWWRVIGAPLDAGGVRDLFSGVIWELIRGVAPVERPPRDALGRRYAEVLQENLGQPGFGELVLVTTDLDARRDVVAVLLREPFKTTFLTPLPGRDRRADVLDLTGVAREHAVDIVTAALTPPLVCEPELVSFASDSFWRGETHRMCDRPGSVNRLLEEVAAAGATQAIVVSAVPPAQSPHRLRAVGLDVRSRYVHFQTAAEAAALRDALEMARLRFTALYVVCPAHNPVGAFDFTGAYDAASDRRQDLDELMARAYDDAYQQFIDPVVGASGELLARATTEDLAPLDSITGPSREFEE
jgi:hypothetical protein